MSDVEILNFASPTDAPHGAREADTDLRHSRIERTGTGATFARLEVSGSSRFVAAALGGAHVWARVRYRLVRAWRAVTTTVTAAGWLTAGVAPVGLWVGLVFGFIEAMSAGVVALVLLIAAAPFLVGIRDYGVDLTLTRDRVVAGNPVHGAIRVTNVGRRLALPGRIDVPVGAGLVGVHVPLLRAGHTFAEAVYVPAHKRGVIAVGPARTVRGDPIGLLRRELPLAEKSVVYVHPVTAALPSTGTGFIKDLEGEPTSVLVDADVSFHAIRPYQPGDAQRQIHWKSTAKTGTLMVRQYEETRRSRMTIVLALGAEDYASDDEFELAVSAAASLGVRAIRDGRSIDVVVGGEVPQMVRASVRSVRELRTVTTRVLLDDLAGVVGGPVAASVAIAPLADACRLATDLHPDMSVAVIVCGSTLTARALQTAALNFPGNVAVAAIVCNAEALPTMRRLGQVRVISIALLDDLRHLMARGAQG